MLLLPPAYSKITLEHSVLACGYLRCVELNIILFVVTSELSYFVVVDLEVVKNRSTLVHTCK